MKRVHGNLLIFKLIARDLAALAKEDKPVRAAPSLDDVQPSSHRLWRPSAPDASFAGHFSLRRADKMRLVVTHGTVR